MLNIVRGYIIHYLGLFWGRKHAEKRLFSPLHNVNRRNRRYGLKTRHKHTLFACIVLLHVVKYMFYNVKALCKVESVFIVTQSCLLSYCVKF